MPGVRAFVPVQVIVCTLLLSLSATAAAARQGSDFGTLSIQVRPPHAEIYIDGERWTGPEATDPLQVQLSPGTHRVEIRSPGRQTFAREIIIRAGETLPLNVSLTPGAPGVAPAAPVPPAPPRPRAPGTPPQQGTTRVTTGEDGFVFAPDFRVTQIDHETGTLVGAYGGYVFAGQFLVGAGGYWQANETNGAHLAYAGPVVEYRMLTDKAIGFNLHALLGAGWRYADHGYYWGRHDGPYPQPAGRYYGMPYGWHDETFFVAEPEAQVVIRFSPSLRLQGGIGYRATSAHGLDGVSGAVSVQVGR